jgi:penicillin-binding protein 1A
LLRWSLIAAASVVLLGATALGVLYFLIAPKLPDVETLRTVELQEPMYVYSRDGRLMALFGETRRYPINIEEVPKQLKQAFLAAEDARFYKHHGVDYKGIARAMWLLATTNDKRVPGGSTITQQVARQFFLSQEYSYKRKLAEMMLAMRIENELSKDEIFELYLNKSFFGHRSYGVGAAAEFYYGKKLNELSLDEMASLAAIPKFPSTANPLSNPARAKERRDVYILQRMAQLKYISQAEADAAKAVPMHASPHERPGRGQCPVRGRNGAAGNGRPVWRRGADQGLPRHHHDRPDPAGHRRQGDPRGPAYLRPAPRLARRRATLRLGRR